MLSLDNPLRINGYTIFRDYTDENQYYYLPADRVRVADDGKALHFVAYSDDISRDPDFDLSRDHAGGFLTMTVELGPDVDDTSEDSSSEAEALRTALQTAVGQSVKLGMVPFHDGKVSLAILGRSGGGEAGWRIDMAGSTKPSLYGKQRASFSVRLGGKAANVLWQTLRASGDAQAVVVYELEFMGVLPAYHLDVHIKFQNVYEHTRHRVGFTTPVSNLDLDFLIQELQNTGDITIKEIDYTTGSSSNSMVQSDRNVLRLIRDLMSPVLFQPSPLPSADYRALPDSATTAAGYRSSVPAGESEQPRPEKQTVEKDGIKVEHTPIADGQARDRAVDIVATITTELASPSAKVKYRNSDSGAFQEVTLARQGTTTEYKGAIPANEQGIQDGKTLQYSLEVVAGAEDDRKTVRLPEDSDEHLSFRVGEVRQRRSSSARDPRRTGFHSLRNFAENTRVGYSLRYVDHTELVERNFKLTKAKAAERAYHPSGVIDQATAGDDFDAADQVTYVRLGEGPFEIIQIQAQLGFDVDRWRVRTAILHIDYGDVDGDGYSQSLDITLGHVTDDSGNDRIRRAGKAQFFADDAGTQEFQYYVRWVFEAESVVGGDPGQEIRSPTFTSTERSITLDLVRHSPLIPVEVVPGVLALSPKMIKEVHVRARSRAGGDSRVVMLEPGADGAITGSERLHVFPAPAGGAGTEDDEAAPSAEYDVETTYFIGDEQLVLSAERLTDSQIIVNEPENRVYRMKPRYLDPDNLVTEMRVDARYTHEDDTVERALLVLTREAPEAEFAVLRSGDDPTSWQATTTFLMREGAPLTGRSLSYTVEQPLIRLDESGFRVARIELMNDAATLFTNGLVGLRVSMGPGVTVAGEAMETFALKPGVTDKTVIVPGLDAGAAVPVRVEELRTSGAAAAPITGTIAPHDDTFYLVIATP